MNVKEMPQHFEAFKDDIRNGDPRAQKAFSAFVEWFRCRGLGWTCDGEDGDQSGTHAGYRHKDNRRLNHIEFMGGDADNDEAA